MKEEDRPQSCYTVVHATRKEKIYAGFIGIIIGFSIGLSCGFYVWVL